MTEGTECNPSDGSTCRDDGAALRCEDGVYALFHCRGPNGCYEESGQIMCDFRRSREGDNCPSNNEDTYLCDNDFSALHCIGGRWEIVSCPGGCEEDGATLYCRP